MHGTSHPHQGRETHGVRCLALGLDEAALDVDEVGGGGGLVRPVLEDDGAVSVAVATHVWGQVLEPFIVGGAGEWEGERVAQHNDEKEQVEPSEKKKINKIK